MKFGTPICIALVAAISVSGYSISLARTPERCYQKIPLNKTERLVRQLMSDVHREKRTLTQSEAEKLFQIARQARHEANEATVVLLTFGTMEQKEHAKELAFQIGSSSTEAQRVYALLSMKYAKDARWKSIAQAIPPSDSGFELAQALLNQAD